MVGGEVFREEGLGESTGLSVGLVVVGLVVGDFVWTT